MDQVRKEFRTYIQGGDNKVCQHIARYNNRKRNQQLVEENALEALEFAILRQNLLGH